MMLEIRSRVAVRCRGAQNLARLASHSGHNDRRAYSPDLSFVINKKNAPKKLHVMHLRVLVDFTATVMGIERRIDFRKQLKSNRTRPKNDRHMKLSNASCLIVNESFIYLLDTNAPLTQRNRSKRYYVLTKSVDTLILPKIQTFFGS